MNQKIKQVAIGPIIQKCGYWPNQIHTMYDKLSIGKKEHQLKGLRFKRKYGKLSS